jgi:hypothetical protein
LKLDAATHARLALIGILGVTLACAAASNIGESPEERPASHPADFESKLSDFASKRLGEADAGRLAFLDRLSHQTLGAADVRIVLGYLNHSNWEVARRAHRVLQTHGCPELAEAQLKLLERLVLESRHPAEVLPDFQRHLTRLAALHEILDSLESPRSDELREVLIQFLDLGPDGRTRSRALEVLATRPPADWFRLVLHALDDPSEQVRLVALDLVSANGWTEAASAIEPLASSPRPTLRRRAAEVLEQFGRRVDPIEYGESVTRAAGELSDRLRQAGINPRDAIAATARQVDEVHFIEMLHRSAEDYLDRGPPANSRPMDARGILYLAAAARAGHRKLTVRLWEHEIGRTDTDEEMLDRGLECWARNRILAGLASYERGNKTEALHALTPVANIAAESGRSASLQVYVRQSGALSAAIWQSTIHHGETNSPTDQRTSTDPVARLATQLLNRLDLANPDHRIEAHRRVDAWCGLAPAAEPTGVHRRPLAN